jgi:hypothetical protein
MKIPFRLVCGILLARRYIQDVRVLNMDRNYHIYVQIVKNIFTQTNT